MRVTSKQNIERVKLLANSGHLPELDVNDLLISITPHEVVLGKYTILSHQNGMYIYTDNAVESNDITDLKLRGVVVGLTTSREVTNHYLRLTVNIVLKWVTGDSEYLESDSLVTVTGNLLNIIKCGGENVTLNLDTGVLEVSHLQASTTVSDLTLQFIIGMLYAANMI